MKYLFDCLDVRVFKNRHRRVTLLSCSSPITGNSVMLRGKDPKFRILLYT